MQKKVEEKKKELEKNKGEISSTVMHENFNVSCHSRQSSIRTPRNLRYYEKVKTFFSFNTLLTALLGAFRLLIQKGEVRFCCGGATDTLPRESATPLIPTSIKRKEPPNKILGVRASDIDKYSRVVFPIMFLSFHLMYWMIYLTISNEVADDLVYLQMPN